jgi:hypothetical protein
VRARLHLDFNKEIYTDWRDCVRKTYATGGAGAFYRGIGYTLVRAGPVSAATLVSYEYFKDLFESLENKARR